MRITTLALIAAAAAVATIAVPATAHADSNSSFSFQSPPGNIGCEMFTGGAVCTIRDHTWAAPPPAGGDCQYGGYELKLFQGDPPCVGVWPNQIFLYPPPTLACGQTHTVGTMTSRVRLRA